MSLEERLKESGQKLIDIEREIKNLEEDVKSLTSKNEYPHLKFRSKSDPSSSGNYPRSRLFADSKSLADILVKACIARAEELDKEKSQIISEWEE